MTNWNNHAYFFYRCRLYKKLLFFLRDETMIFPSVFNSFGGLNLKFNFFRCFWTSTSDTQIFMKKMLVNSYISRLLIKQMMNIYFIFSISLDAYSYMARGSVIWSSADDGKQCLLTALLTTSPIASHGLFPWHVANKLYDSTRNPKSFSWYPKFCRWFLTKNKTLSK